jgi:hypothetical protein
VNGTASVCLFVFNSTCVGSIGTTYLTWPWHFFPLEHNSIAKVPDSLSLQKLQCFMHLIVFFMAGTIPASIFFFQLSRVSQRVV